MTSEQISFIDRVRAECQGKLGDEMVCREVTQALHDEYGWEIEAGYYHGPGHDIRITYGKFPGHHYIRMDDGTIIDPTHDQYEPGTPLLVIPSDDPRQSWYDTIRSVTASIWQGITFSEGGDAVGSNQYSGYIRAFIGGTQVGYFDYAILHNWNERDSLSISMVEVEPEYRRQGLATLMLDEVIKRQYTNWGKQPPEVGPGLLTDMGAQWWPSVENKYAATNWRALISGDKPFWKQHDFTIATQMRGRQRYFTLWVMGELFRNYPRLDDAKVAIEAEFGSLNWKHIQMPKATAYHYYFGWTDEFTDPANIYVADIEIG